MLTDLFVVLVAAKLGDEVFKRIGQPAIVGEVLGGVLVGLQTRLSEMRAVGRIA